MTHPTLTKEEIQQLANENGYEYAALMAVIDVESSGHGYSSVTGKMLIQFEPLWFKRKYEDWKEHTSGHTWQDNKVQNQTKEWIAFNDAVKIDKNAAMEATSIGMMQVMGFHWKMMGFSSVAEMWAWTEMSEFNMVELGIKFIKTNKRMDDALIGKFWNTFAHFYNGAGYKRFKYDTRLDYSYKHYKANT